MCPNCPRSIENIQEVPGKEGSRIVVVDQKKTLFHKKPYRDLDHFEKRKFDNVVTLAHLPQRVHFEFR